MAGSGEDPYSYDGKTEKRELPQEMVTPIAQHKYDNRVASCSTAWARESVTQCHEDPTPSWRMHGELVGRDPHHIFGRYGGAGVSACAVGALRALRHQALRDGLRVVTITIGSPAPSAARRKDRGGPRNEARFAGPEGRLDEPPTRPRRRIAAVLTALALGATWLISAAPAHAAILCPGQVEVASTAGDFCVTPLPAPGATASASGATTNTNNTPAPVTVISETGSLTVASDDIVDVNFTFKEEVKVI
ncbi:hypothetical protein GCM10010211_71370 [Streptomyces albospinus]|uniref:Uncharacterized protein n=1 Tax=Streptomyces albospinus TaxID=285515 RepID=A0ABQ2VMM1_9ACTN|nr:hypothetical protein [Streptomyces albospinus]GGU94023.1 hypothetical protein GCM10010211_71370 [Streptomyces albospinus]